MLPVSTPGPSFAGGYSSTGHQVMKVFTVTIIDDRSERSRRNDVRQLQSKQYRRTTMYDRFARAVTSAIPPTVDIRI
jgi:hypothetical protein